MQNLGPRTVSLLPSATEIVFALGKGECLVGRSHECDYPGEAVRVPVCTETKLLKRRTSSEMDKDVKTILSEGLSIYRVLGQRLRDLNPEVIVTQTQCEVCAASLADVKDAVKAWLSDDVHIVPLDPRSLEHIWTDFRLVGEALGAAKEAEALVGRCQERMAAIAKRAAGADHCPTVATLEWLNPLMAGGNWMPELVQMAGGENLFAEAGRHSPLLEWEALLAADPEVIVLVPCGFDIPRTLAEIDSLTSRPGWGELSAVRNGRVYVMDGNAYFNRPGPRIVDSLEILATALHPEVFLSEPAHPYYEAAIFEISGQRPGSAEDNQKRGKAQAKP